MAAEHEASESDRWQVIKVLFAEGKTFPEMIPILGELGLLECKKDHRTRRNRDGSSVCATCEMTISQQWRRGLARLTEQEADVLAVKGAWIEAHEFIRDTCRKRCIKVHRHEVTRVLPDGTQETTVDEHTTVNLGLLRLLAQVSDKLARVAGVDVEKSIPSSVPVELHFHERDPDSTGDDGAPN